MTIRRLGPTRRIVRQEGHDDLGELRCADTVGHLATGHDDDAVAFLVGQRQGRAHGVAVAAEHTAIVVDGDAVDLGTTHLDLGRLDGRRGAGRNRQGNFAHLVEILVVDHRRFAMVAQNGDVRAVHRAAHVQTAGQGNTQLGRHAVGLEVVEHLVHDGLDRTRSVCGRGVAVDPALGVDDVGDAMFRCRPPGICSCRPRTCGFPGL